MVFTTTVLIILHYLNSDNRLICFRCGRGGRIAPVDALDRCCLERAKCYGRQVQKCPDIWSKPYDTMYAWTLLNHMHLCGMFSQQLLAIFTNIHYNKRK